MASNEFRLTTSWLDGSGGDGYDESTIDNDGFLPDYEEAATQEETPLRGANVSTSAMVWLRRGHHHAQD